MATKAWRVRSTTSRRLPDGSSSSLSKRIRASTAASACGRRAARKSSIAAPSVRSREFQTGRRRPVSTVAASLLTAICKRSGCLQHRATSANSASDAVRGFRKSKVFALRATVSLLARSRDVSPEGSESCLDGQTSFESRGPAGSGDWEREVAVGTLGLELRYGRVGEVRHPYAQKTRLHLVLLAPVEQRLSDERPLRRFGVGRRPRWMNASRCAGSVRSTSPGTWIASCSAWSMGTGRHQFQGEGSVLHRRPPSSREGDCCFGSSRRQSGRGRTSRCVGGF